ncbi:hypothetical protein Dsin_016974, partial [Dipteronia sinensis]
KKVGLIPSPTKKERERDLNSATFIVFLAEKSNKKEGKTHIYNLIFETSIFGPLTSLPTKHSFLFSLLPLPSSLKVKKYSHQIFSSKLIQHLLTREGGYGFVEAVGLLRA